ncbi:MAG: LCP family protein [Cyanobacteriota bacterium]|jgi:LCP family protein required for cell wall assembly
MTQAPLIPPRGRTSRPRRERSQRRRPEAPAPLELVSNAPPSPVVSTWRRRRLPALTFGLGLTLGYALAAPPPALAQWLASLAQGPKGVAAILAPFQAKEPPILVLGSDQVSGSTDVMFTVRVGDGLTRITQVPRDTFVESPKLGAQKINALYASAGIETAREAVGELLGTPVPSHLKVNLRAVERVAEALGGVEVDVPKRMYYVDNAQGLYIDLYPGRQTLKGKELEGFLRFRHDEAGDLGRMERQRLVINEVFRKLARPSTLVQLPTLLKIAGEDIDTNLSPLDLSRLAAEMARSKMSTERLPGRLYWQDDLSYWMPDSNKEHATGSGQEPLP